MEWLGRITAALDHIENNITEDIMYDKVAKIACCSMHQFGRVFSYIVGVSLSEYIRRRRLTLAAQDLQGTNEKVIDIAMKYGYDSPDAFTRAFYNVHGVTPREARNFGVKLKAYPPITFHISIRGAEEMEYRIEDKKEINLVGVVRRIKRQSANELANDWKEAAGEEWAAWQDFFQNGTDQKLSEFKLYSSPMWQMGFTMTLEGGDTLLAIGAEAGGETPVGLDTYTIPLSQWAVFTVKGSLENKDHPVDAMWTRITAEWFPSSGYTRAGDFEIQVYPPGNTASNDYQCEIWVPVTRKDRHQYQPEES